MDFGDEIATENADFLFLIQHERVDECTIHLHEFPDALNKRNKMQETALHIAVKNVNLVHLLLNNGADVNVINYWGQTPLHYAVQARAVASIRRLLQDKRIDVNCKDANGYTALHYIFTSVQECRNNREDCFYCLVDAGANINCTTNTGKSVLHQISYLYDHLKTFFYFKVIFGKCTNVDLFSTDIAGKTFLHTWNQFQEADLNLLALIERCQSKENIAKLINQKDFSGISPFMNVVCNDNTSNTMLNTLVNSYGALLDSTDNMGNTVLHLMSTGGSMRTCKQIEMVLKLGINVNAKNIFGQNALFLLTYEDVFEVFSNLQQVKWESCDRWNRTLYSESICNNDVHRLLVYKIYEKRSFNIIEDDIFTSTPLHLAAYFGNISKLELVFELTPSFKMTDRDDMGDLPADTALRHGNIECYKIIDEKSDRTRYLPPEGITLSELNGLRDIRVLLKDFPEDTKDYFDHLLLNRHTSNNSIAQNAEDLEIISAVNNLVSCICDAVTGYDSRFDMSVFQTGSTADGTKVGPPNEFDFALCLRNLSKICNVETPANAANQFVCLKFEENAVSDYVSFSDENRYFVALPFLHYLSCYLRRAFKEERLWEHGKMSMRPDEPMIVLSRKPVFNFRIYWNGSKYKKLKISIDLLPAVHKSGWWPNFISRGKSLADEVIKAGCFVILHTKMNEFDKEWTVYTPMNDNINTTCKRQNESTGKHSENNDHLLLRVSVAPAEITLMRSLPEQIRKAYSLAKIVLMKDVCPRVIIDGTPPGLDLPELEKFVYEYVSNYKHIKSYWLKNCTFYVAEETDCKENTLEEITRLIYEKLLEFATTGKFNAYLFQQTDIWASEKIKVTSRLTIRKPLFLRKICIDIVLGFLGKPFPDDNSKWVLRCEEQYRPFTEYVEMQPPCLL